MKSTTIFFLLLLCLAACNPVKKFKSGGFGSVGGGGIGNASSLVTISGKVMSSATFSGSSSFSVIPGSHKSFILAQNQKPLDFETEIPYVQNVCADNPCASAGWNLKYVGSDTTVAAGSSNCGDFNIPSIPEGKEGVVTFTCTGGTQRCLVKAGDNGISCNAVADAVVGALEVSLDAPLSSSTLVGKTIAKVATSIVESTNSDSSDAEELKAAIETCKGIADLSSKKSCYKNSLDSSNQSGAMSVVKTLAQTWTVSNLFNFMIGTGGYAIYLDDMIYSPFGDALDDWFGGGDFVVKTKAFIQDLVTNPEYIGGDPAKGQQQVKMECSASYSKHESGGQAAYKPAFVAGRPTCAIASEIATITGLLATDPKVVAFLATMATGSHGQFQFGDAVDGNGDPLPCSNNGQPPVGSFCMWTPELVIKSKYTEPDRNDPAGEHPQYFNENRLSLINAFPAVMTKLTEMQAESVAAGPKHLCVQGMEHDGSPVFNLGNLVCKNWLKTEMSALKTEFSGLVGLYYYLNNQAIYKGAGTGKLSLNDIHKIFTRLDFMNSKVYDLSWGEYQQRNTVAGVQAQPMVDFSTSATPFMPGVYNYMAVQTANPGTFNNPLSDADFADLIHNGSLLNEYNRTFKMFEKIPDNTALQAFVQNSSHHADYNPLGSKYNMVLAAKKALNTDTSYPIFCKMVNKITNFPMLKELNSDSKIECLSDPATAGVVASVVTDGLFTVPAGFSYPYVLQQRGFNGDSKGKLYALADRRTGQSIRIGYSEIYVLEAKAGNDSSFVVSGTCNLAVNGSTVKAKVFYGQGSDSRNEVISAYCLNMTDLSQSDNETRVYQGGRIDITQNNNGQVFTYQMQLVGGRLTDAGNVDNFNLKPICWFTNGDYFEFDNTTWMYKAKASAVGVANGTYTFQNNQIVNKVQPLAGEIDFCDSTTHGTNTKLNLTQVYDKNNFDVTVPASRGAMPIGIYNANDKINYWGIVTDIASVESLLADLRVANTTGVTWNYNLNLLNQKHNARFDPFCDDKNANGHCDCKDTAGVTVTDRECNLADTPMEPTLSNPPYNKGGQQDSSAYENFFATNGGHAGAALTGINGNILNNAHMYFNLQEVLQCQFIVTGELTFRHPQNFWWGQDWGNLHFDGCPDSNGDVIAVGNYVAQDPTTGGGPIRLINPQPMNNAFDIIRPNNFLTMIQYATKNIGQGITIKATDKLFGFDEAVALIAARNMLPPKDITVRRDSLGGAVYKNASLMFSPGRVANSSDITNVINNVLKGITKPTTLTDPEPDTLYFMTHLPQN